MLTFSELGGLVESGESYDLIFLDGDHRLKTLAHQARHLEDQPGAARPEIVT